MATPLHLTYLTCCEWLACLRLDVTCVKGKPPTDKPPFFLLPMLIVHFIEFTHYNDRFMNVITTHKHEKYDVLILTYN